MNVPLLIPTFTYIAALKTCKNYTYIADDCASAAQWLREIEEVRLGIQADSPPS